MHITVNRNQHGFSIGFLDGFGESKHTRCEHEELRRWQQRKKHNQAKVKLFKCDLAGLTNGSIDIQSAVNSLASQIHALAVPLGSHRPNSAVADSGLMDKTDSSKPLPGEPSFILVAHGLGCWVLRKFIHRERHTPTVVNTIAAIFLDVPESNQPYDPQDYRAHLETAKATFKLRSEISPELVDGLYKIDKDFFETTLGYIQRSTGQRLQYYFLSVWQDRGSEKVGSTRGIGTTQY
jgi:hypothetical protein